MNPTDCKGCPRCNCPSGKTVRSSKDENTNPIHVVSAFASESALVLGQFIADGKGGELRAFEQLVGLLDLKALTVIVDATGCHKSLAEKVIDKGGDYILALKGNQPALFAEVNNFFGQAVMVEPVEAQCDYFCWEERAQGYLSTRDVWATDQLEWLDQTRDWVGLRTIVCTRVTKQKEGKTTCRVRYHVLSRRPGLTYEE